MNPINFNTPAQNLVNALNQWHRSLAVQCNDLFPQPLHRQLVDFDPMYYFALLPQIQPPAGRVLDWLYVGNKNGWPFLYWRDAQAAPHTQVEQLYQEPGWMHGQDMQKAITEPVQTDGSSQGYLQLVLFRLKAGHAMLRWHAAYKSVSLLCSQKELEDLVSRQSSKEHFMQNMNADTARAAMAMDVTPTVDLSEPGIARVSLTRFSQWGGFYRQTWVMNCQGPHALAMEHEVKLVHYDCGVTF
jgi:hypothetical protein